MHKDLSDTWREAVEAQSRVVVSVLKDKGQSYALAREAMTNAFDAAAESASGGPIGN